MKRRGLKYRINWQNVWKKMRSERIRKPRITYDKDFSNKICWKDLKTRMKK